MAVKRNAAAKVLADTKTELEEAKKAVEDAPRNLGRGVNKKLNKALKRAKKLNEKATRKDSRLAKELKVAEKCYDIAKKELRIVEKELRIVETKRARDYKQQVRHGHKSTTKQVKIPKDFKVACGVEIYMSAIDCGETRQRNIRFNTCILNGCEATGFFKLEIPGSQYSLSKATKAIETNKLLSVKYLETAECGSSMAVNINKNNVSRGGIKMNLQLLGGKSNKPLPRDLQDLKEKAEKYGIANWNAMGYRELKVAINQHETFLAKLDKKMDQAIRVKGASKKHMTQKNKELTNLKYDVNFLVNRVDLQITDTEITQQFCTSVEGRVQSFKYFLADTRNEKVLAKSYDDTGKEISCQIYSTGIRGNANIGIIPAYDDLDNKEWTKYRRISNDLLLVQFNGFGEAPINFYSRYGVAGFYVGKKDDGERKLFFSYEELVNNKEGYDIDGYYAHYEDSSSSLKSGSVFFAKLNCSIEDARDRSVQYVQAMAERIEQIDAVTGKALIYTINKLEKKRLAAVEGQEAVIPSDYSKEMVRSGLIGVTPLVKLGELSNMLLIKGKIATPEEFVTEADREIMKRYGIDNFHPDGYNVLSSDFIIECMKKVLDKDYTENQALSLGLQTRADVLVMKAFSRVYDSNAMKIKAMNLIKDFGDKAVIYINKIAISGLKQKYTGSEILELNKTNPNIVNAILESLDIISTANENKAVNWDELDNGVLPNLYLVNAPEETKTETSVQVFNKIVDNPELRAKANRLADALIGEKATKATDVSSVMAFNKDFTGISNRPLDAMFEALGKDAAFKDRALASNKLRADATALVSAIAKARLDIEADYLTLVPNDLYIAKDIKGTFVDLLHARDVEYVSPEEMAKAKAEGRKPISRKVRAIEVYSRTANEKIQHDIEIFAKNIIENKHYTIEEFEMIKESFRLQTMLKYPTQGTNEFVLVYHVSNKEMNTRIENDSFSKEAKNALKMFFFKSPYNSLIVAASNSMKNACAGFDFDADEAVTVPNNLSMNEKGQIVYGLVIPEEDKAIIVDSYNAIIVDKYYMNGCKYICTCVSYPEVVRPKYGPAPVTSIKKVKSIKGVKNTFNNANYVGSYNEYVKNIENMFDVKFNLPSKTFLNMPYVPNYGKIQDLLGFYAANNNVGDDIGMSIVLCSVVIMNSEMFKTDANGDKHFNFNLFRKLFSPLKLAEEPRYPKAYKSIFTEGENKISCTDRFGITWDYYLVTDEIIKRFVSRLRGISKDCTVSEWEQVVADFVHITRALGESSIDCKKDVNKAYSYKAEDIVNRKMRCYGNIKKEHILYDNDIFSKEEDSKEVFAFSISEEGFLKHYDALHDPVGDIKEKMIKEYSRIMNINKNEMISDSNYKWYEKQYHKEDPAEYLTIKYPNTANVINAVIRYLLKDSIPVMYGQKLTTSLSKEEKITLKASLYNLARLEGCQDADVVRIAIEQCFYKGIKRNRETGVLYPAFNFNPFYSGKLNTVINFFKELFIIERTKDDMDNMPVGSIPIRLNLDLDSDKLTAGEVYDFVDGVCIDNDNIKLETPFTGQAQALNSKKLITLFFPLQHVVPEEDKDVLTFEIAAFAGTDEAIIDAKRENLNDYIAMEDGQPVPYGLQAAKDGSNYELIIDCEEVPRGGQLLVLKTIDGKNIAILNHAVTTEDLSKLVGKTISNFICQGYHEIKEDIKRNEKTGEHETVTRAIDNWFISGTVK